MTSGSLPPQAWLGALVFAVSGVWSLVANFRLAAQLRSRGVQVPASLAGVTLLVYVYLRPKDEPRETDRTAIAGAIAIAVLVATVFYLQTFIAPEGY